MSNLQQTFTGQRPAAIYKYAGEQDERHNGYLYWQFMPFGLPLRLRSSNVLPKLDLNEIYEYTTLVADWRHDLFDLSNEDDRKAYQWVQDRIANGWFRQIFVERHWDDERKNYHIYLEWAQLYSELTKDASHFT